MMVAFFKRLFSKKNSIAGAGLILMVTLVGSNILGLFRDRFLAQKIHTYYLDTYFAAFRIPDLLFNLFVLGAISSAFIPVFTSFIAKKKFKTSWRITNSVINIIILLMIFIPAILVILMPWLIPWIVPGFSSEQKIVTTNLARILLATPLFFGISFIIGGVANSYRRFVAYSLSPIIYNLSIILATLLFADKYGVYGVAVGVVCGAFLHMAIQLPTLKMLGFAWQAILDLKDPAVKQIFKLMIPRMIGLGANQVVLIIFTFLASAWQGNITYFNFANNIQTFISIVFGASLAIAVFPVISRQASLEHNNNFSASLSQTFRQIMFFIIPTSILLLFLRAEIVRLILGTGFYGWEATRITANTLGIFVVGIWASSLIQLLARGFYAYQNTKTPMYLAIFSSFLMIIIAIILSRGFTIGSQTIPSMHVYGLALAFSIGNIFNTILLWILLKNKIRKEDSRLVIISTVKYSVIGLLMVPLIELTKIVSISFLNVQLFFGVLAKVIVVSLVSLGFYLLMTYLWDCEEISAFGKIFKKYMPEKN